MTNLIIILLPILIAIIAHEVAHGYVAYKLGDKTAKNAGRLSLNPASHVDVFGTLILPMALLISQLGFVFGWAKPVPINPKNFSNPKRDLFLVSVSGIVANFLLALISAFFIYLLSFFNGLWQVNVNLFFVNLLVFNVILIVFNILPIPPLDGSKIFLGWSDNPLIKRYVSEDKYGLLAIAVLVFILPFLKIDIFGFYIVGATKFLLSFLM